MDAIRVALAQRLPQSVSFDATVTSPPRFFFGTHTRAWHETFDARTPGGERVAIVDNIAISPRVPVVPGDRISVRGDLVRDPSGAPVVHWTHHDPAGRHPDGYIDVSGRRYA